MSPSAERPLPVDFDAPFDPAFTGDPIPPIVPDLAGAKISHIALDSSLRVSLSTGWLVTFCEAACVALAGEEPKRLEFIFEVDPDDKYLTPELRMMVDQPVTAMHLSRQQGHLALETPKGRILIDGRYCITPWEMWGPDQFIDWSGLSQWLRAD